MFAFWGGGGCFDAAITGTTIVLESDLSYGQMDRIILLELTRLCIQKWPGPGDSVKKIFDRILMLARNGFDWLWLKYHQEEASKSWIYSRFSSRDLSRISDSFLSMINPNLEKILTFLWLILRPSLLFWSSNPHWSKRRINIAASSNLLAMSSSVQQSAVSADSSHVNEAIISFKSWPWYYWFL